MTGSAARAARLSPVAVVAFVMFTTTLASNAPSPLYVIWQQRFGYSAATLTWIFAAYALGVIVALVAFGRLSDELGRRRIMLPSLVMLAVSAVLFASAADTGWLLVARAVQGLATGTLTAAATAALVELEPNGDRRRASFLNTLSFIAGAAGGPLIVGILAEYAPLPRVLPFLFELALIAAGWLLLRRVVPETVVAVESFAWRLQRPSVPRSIRHPFAAAALMLAVAWAVGALYGSLSPSIDRDLLHVSNHAVAGLVLFVNAGIGGLAQIWLRLWPSRRTMVLGALGLCVGMVLVGWSLSASSIGLFVGGTVLAGSGSGIAFMGSLQLLNDVAPPRRRAEGVSAYNIVGYIALSLPVIGVGTLAGHIGLQRASDIFIVVVVAVSLVAVAMTLLLPRQVGAAPKDALLSVGLDPATRASGVD